jgi:hypothetical protein
MLSTLTRTENIGFIAHAHGQRKAATGLTPTHAGRGNGASLELLRLLIGRGAFVSFRPGVSLSVVVSYSIR